jgi:putative aldouronate transport system substrate-binding protein
MPEKMSSRPFTVTNANRVGTTTVYKTYDTSIIAKQNALVTGTNTANGGALAVQLRNYIDSTYRTATGGSEAGERFFGDERSQLFIGANAAYDPDELVALLRAIRANTGYLMSDGARANAYRNPDRTGVWETAPIVPFFPRSSNNDRNLDLFRLATIWGVRGLESRYEMMFLHNDNTILDARTQANTMHGLLNLHNLYREHLILQDYSNHNPADSATEGLGGGDHRQRLMTQNLGFMTYDFAQTTLVFNDPAVSWAATNVPGYEFRPILPPFTTWTNPGNAGTDTEAATVRSLTRFTDSWRGVKNDGSWAVLRGNTTGAPTDVQIRAMQMMDYLWHPDGARLMGFGPDAYLQWETIAGVDASYEAAAANPAGHRVRTFAYAGQQWPVMGAHIRTTMGSMSSGNYTNHYRRVLGGTFPIGYVKEQAMEIQFTWGWGSNDHGVPVAPGSAIRINTGLANIAAAQAQDTNGFMTAATTFEFATQRPSPTTPPQNRAINTSWPFTQADRDTLAFTQSAYNRIQQLFSTAAGASSHAFNQVVRNGFVAASIPN